MKFILIICFMCTEISLAHSLTPLPLMLDPFDIAAGGASTTRASRDGRIFNNPALLSLGADFHHWAGLKVTPVAGASHYERVIKNSGKVGGSLSLSWLNKAFGMSLFLRLNANPHFPLASSTGTPEMELSGLALGGAYFALPIPTPFRWLKLGVSAKMIGLAKLESITLNDEKVSSLLDSETRSKELELYENILTNSLLAGAGTDLGMLLFFQGHHLDFLIGYKLQNAGKTSLYRFDQIKQKYFANTKEEKNEIIAIDDLPMTSNIGLGFTLHNSKDQIHFSLDYWDVENKNKIPLFKRVYAGTKITIRKYIGIATGLYHGNVSGGLELDLILFKINGTTYKEEFANKIGIRSYRNYLLTFSTGF